MEECMKTGAKSEVEQLKVVIKELETELENANESLNDYRAYLEKTAADMRAAETKANVYKAKCEAYEGIIGMVKELRK